VEYRSLFLFTGSIDTWQVRCLTQQAIPPKRDRNISPHPRKQIFLGNFSLPFPDKDLGRGPVPHRTIKSAQ